MPRTRLGTRGQGGRQSWVLSILLPQAGQKMSCASMTAPHPPQLSRPRPVGRGVAVSGRDAVADGDDGDGSPHPHDAVGIQLHFVRLGFRTQDGKKASQ